jgi:anti-anti-sigma factor
MSENWLGIQIHDGPRHGEKVMVLEGVLNAETATRFRDSARKYESATLVVDMSRVRYVDSSGLGVLIAPAKSRTSSRDTRRLPPLSRPCT